MIDIFIILLVFLLKSYTGSPTTFPTPPNLVMPISKGKDFPPDSPFLIITPEAITFENKRVVEFTINPESSSDSTAPNYAFRPQDLDEKNLRIIPLYAALNEARERSELLRAQSRARDAYGNPLPFEGIIAIMADKEVTYDTLRKVMYTGAASGFKVYRFLAKKKD